jgi:hypothetical protein
MEDITGRRTDMKMTIGTMIDINPAHHRRNSGCILGMKKRKKIEYVRGEKTSAKRK